MDVLTEQHDHLRLEELTRLAFYQERRRLYHATTKGSPCEEHRRTPQPHSESLAIEKGSRPIPQMTMLAMPSSSNATTIRFLA